MAIWDSVESQADERSYSLLTCTRYDKQLEKYNWNDDHEGPSPFFLLPLHLDRLISAAETHNWPNAKSLLKYSLLKSACLDAQAIAEKHRVEEASNVFKLRITVSKEGHMVVTTSRLPAESTFNPTFTPSNNPEFQSEDQAIPAHRIYLDTEAIAPSVFTLTKTTFREVYNQVKTRNECILRSTPEGTASEVLMYNRDGQITESSISNVAFYRTSCWLTPSTASGCLAGVMRRWLLENNQIREDKDQILTKDSIREGEWVLLFNGVQGCRLGKIYK